jgi:hypothetical protein
LRIAGNWISSNKVDDPSVMADLAERQRKPRHGWLNLQVGGVRRLVGLRDRLDVTRNFGLNASAFVDIDMGNSRVFRHIDIR